MAYEKEFEAKSLLSEAEYFKLLDRFEVNSADAKLQANYYLDTDDALFKNLGGALRIRQTASHAVMTLKIKQDDYHDEWTIPLSNQQLTEFLELIGNHQGLIPPPKMQEIFKELEVDFAEFPIIVHPIAILKTWRVEIPISNDLVVLDKSEYHGQTDYEIEIESHSLKQAQNLMENILTAENIPYRFSMPKIARAIQALKNK